MRTKPRVTIIQHPDCGLKIERAVLRRLPRKGGYILDIDTDVKYPEFMHGSGRDGQGHYLMVDLNAQDNEQGWATVRIDGIGYDFSRADGVAKWGHRVYFMEWDKLINSRVVCVTQG